MFLYVVFIIFFSLYIYINLYSHGFLFIFKFIPLILNSFIANRIIFNTFIFDKKSNVLSLYFIGKMSKNMLIVSRILYTFLLNCLTIVIFSWIFRNYLLFSEIIKYIVINFIICICTLLLSLFANVTFRKQFSFFICISNIILSFYLYISYLNLVYIFLLAIFFYILLYKIYNFRILK